MTPAAANAPAPPTTTVRAVYQGLGSGRGSISEKADIWSKSSSRHPCQSTIPTAKRDASLNRRRTGQKGGVSFDQVRSRVYTHGRSPRRWSIGCSAKAPLRRGAWGVRCASCSCGLTVGPRVVRPLLGSCGSFGGLRAVGIRTSLDVRSELLLVVALPTRERSPP